MSRRNLLQTLSKVREIAKTVAEGRLRHAYLLRREQDRSAGRARDRAADAATALAPGEATPASVVRSAAAAGLRLEEVSRQENAKAIDASRAEALAQANYADADRQAQGMERILAERIARARARDAKAEQRRLDDRPRTGNKPTRLGLVLVITFGVMSIESGAGAESLSQNASLERLLSEIQSRTTALDQRSAELDERERAIEEIERTVEARIKELDLVSTEVEDRIGEWEASQGAKTISRLSKIYGAMPPPRAAALVEELDIDLATQVLTRMKPKESAALLPLLSPARALTITRFVGHPLGIASTPPNEAAK